MKTPCGTRYQLEVLMDGLSSHGSVIRRPILVQRGTGLLHELGTAFLFREYPTNALNTQKAVLRDLAFFLEWQALRKARDEDWKPPEQRIKLGKVGFPKGEIADFARWAQVDARQLTLAVATQTKKRANLPSGKPVHFQTFNRRMTTVGRYAAWILQECDPRDDWSAEEHRLLESSASDLRRKFQDYTVDGKDGAEIRSLNPTGMAALYDSLENNAELFPNTPVGRRDKLIIEVLLEGLRAGELLKLWCTDVDEHYEYELGKTVGCLSVHLRPNEVNDPRRDEPAGKTLPGLLPIPDQLARRLVDYITGDREAAVEKIDKPPPHLFVNLSGKYVGQPISQRYLNNIVARKRPPGLEGDFTPHVLRHTHFDEIYDDMSTKGVDPRQTMLQRGRWSENSNMPARYARRSITKATAKYTASRDDQIRAR